MSHVPIYGPLGPPLNAAQGAARLGMSKSTFLRAVKGGILPAPFYPSPRSARWYGTELDEAILKTRKARKDAP